MNTRGFLFAGLLAIGCADRTQLVVVVDTDVDTPSAMQELEISVTSADDEPVGDAFFDLLEEPVPLSFGIEPKGALVDEEVTILVEGRDTERTLVIDRRVVTGFVRFERRLLQIFLAEACSELPCDAEHTCDGGTCVSARVEVDGLPFFDPDVDTTVPRGE